MKDCKIQKYLKGLNPQSDDQQILMPGSKYHLWRDGKYLGIAEWVIDENVGDSFQTKKFDQERGIYINQVWIADKWELIIKNKQS